MANVTRHEVSAENGAIAAGDGPCPEAQKVTDSSFAGVWHSRPRLCVIGVAQEDYDGAGVTRISVLVRP